MEQNQEPSNKLMYMWSVNIWQGIQEFTIGKNSIFNKQGLRNRTFTCRSIRLDLYSTHSQKLIQNGLKT